MLYFPPKVLNKMKNLSVTENDILDVYNHGEYGKTITGTNMAVKKYPSQGYEIGIYYSANKYASGDVILSVWKRSRR